MAFNHAQATATGVTNGSSTSTNAVLGVNPVTTDLVISGTFWTDGTANPPASFTVADSAVNSYTKSANSPSSVQQANSASAWIFYLNNAPANATKTVTATYTNPGAGGAAGLNVDDFTVTGGTSAVGTATAGNGNAVSPINTPTVTNAGAGSLEYGYAASGPGITSGNNAPWTQGAIDADSNASQYILSTGSNNALNMTTSGTGGWDSMGISFSFTASAATSGFGHLLGQERNRAVLFG